MKIVVVDDYKIFRAGLILLLKSFKNFKIVGEASNAEELFGLLKYGERPDVILLNLNLPHNQIITISNKISKEYPNLPLVLLTEGADEMLILKCAVNGAKGLLWKDSTPEHLIEAINKVVSGQRYLDVPESKIAAKVREYKNNYRLLNHNSSELSERELEVLKLFAEGHSYKIIADKLNISPRTVESHKNNILMKLELNSVIDMVKYAIKQNLIII